jgi:hypothetical protein
MPRLPRIPWTWIVLGAIGVWLAVVCAALLMPSGPAAPGAPGAAALRADAAKDVREQDPASFQRLFRPDSVGSGYASRYFAELFAVPATRLGVALETQDDLRFLVLRGRTTDGGALCDAWPVQDSGGRSVLSAVPPITDPCGAGPATAGAPPSTPRAPAGA